VVVGLATLAALFVVRADAPGLFAGLTGRALPVALVSVIAGLASLGLLVARRYTAVRVTAALAVTAVIWGGGVALYPVMLPGLTVAQAAGDPAVLSVVLWVLGIGALVLVPSLVYMFVLFQRERPDVRALA
jgi:cytochrome d ubiquinol oxidase subunit II